MAEYISKEFMLKNLEADKMNNAEHCEPVTIQIMERFIRYVKEFPAADVQPVKRGKWKHEEQGYDVYVECSECGLNLDMSNYIENEWREILKYCPCCGARMDGEQE